MRRLLISLRYIAIANCLSLSLVTSPPCVKVKPENVRKNFEFWKHIGTPSFILNVIETGYF